MSGEIAIVSGGAGAIGQVIVRALRARGLTVVIVGRRERELVALAVALVVNLLARRDEGLEAGALILTGGVTEAVACRPGDHVNLRMQELGSVSVRFG